MLPLITFGDHVDGIDESAWAITSYITANAIVMPMKRLAEPLVLAVSGI